MATPQLTVVPGSYSGLTHSNSSSLNLRREDFTMNGNSSGRARSSSSLRMVN